MPVSIRQVGPCFAGEIEGIDMTQPLSPAEAEAIVDASGSKGFFDIRNTRPQGTPRRGPLYPRKHSSYPSRCLSAQPPNNPILEPRTERRR